MDNTRYFETFASARKAIQAFEIETDTQFVMAKKTKNFAKEWFPESTGHLRVWFSGKTKLLPADEIQPYLIVGHLIKQCVHGPIAKKKGNAQKLEVDHAYARILSKRRTRRTKKLGCKSAIRVQEILCFSGFAVNSNRQRKKASRIIKHAISTSSLSKHPSVRKFVVFFPEANSHRKHIGETHPSIRVKGTEANFSPSQCTDPACSNKAFHMHCPFCIKTESYVDPVILKMHYRVKHVDKGVDFAGLKILRCCERCEIVGAIKGEKTFKGAHWHCYKCRNGFNRRDEAIKHYKTHFRNPETTFQIQISQVEESGRGQPEDTSEVSLSCGQSQEVTIHPVLTEAALSSSALSNGIVTRTRTASANGRGDREVQVSVAANETVGSSEAQTIMIIQEGDIEASQPIENSYTVIPGEDYSDDNSAVESVLEELAVTEGGGVQDRVTQLQQRCRALEADKAHLKAEVAELKAKLTAQTEMLTKCQKREQELLHQLSIPLDKGLQALLKQLEKNHKDLLHHQLGTLRRSYLNQQNKEQQTITIPSAALQSAVLGAESGSISITIQRNDMAGDGLGETQTATLDVHQFSQQPSSENADQFDGETCKVINATDGSVLGLYTLGQQSQLSVAAPFDVACSTSDSQAVTLATSDSYDSGLTAVVDSSELNFTTVDNLQVEEAPCDVPTSEIQESTEGPPAKRSKQDSSS